MYTYIYIYACVCVRAQGSTKKMNDRQKLYKHQK